MKASKPKGIAFFDVDHTLIRGNSGFFTSLRLMRYGILKQRRILQAVYYSVAALVFNQKVEKIYQVAIDDMAGATREYIFSIGRECFEKDIKKRIYAEGLARIEEHRRMGHVIALLTAGPSMLIHHLREYVGADEEYSMGPEIVGDVLTRRLRVPICHAAGKVHYAQEASQKYGVPLSQCYFYTDHHTDIPLLEMIGHPRVVNPNRPLFKIALLRNWPVYRFSRTGLPKGVG